MLSLCYLHATAHVSDAARVLQASGRASMAAPSASVQQCRQIMGRFATATGLEGEAPQRRYLWTDALAVCVLLELHTAT